MSGAVGSGLSLALSQTFSTAFRDESTLSCDEQSGRRASDRNAGMGLAYFIPERERCEAKETYPKEHDVPKG